MDILWGGKNDEELYYTDPYDYFHCFISEMGSVGPDSGSLTAYEYARVSIPSSFWSDYVIENFIERLDEEYGNPSSFTKITDSMRAAEEKFCTAVLSEYTPWNMEPTGKTVSIDIYQWCLENEPSWVSSHRMYGLWNGNKCLGLFKDYGDAVFKRTSHSMRIVSHNVSLDSGIVILEESADAVRKLSI